MAASLHELFSGVFVLPLTVLRRVHRVLGRVRGWCACFGRRGADRIGAGQAAAPAALYLAGLAGLGACRAHAVFQGVSGLLPGV
jgi:hypothetical protein